MPDPAPRVPAHPSPASVAEVQEHEWVARVRAGDVAAFEQIFSTYYASLVRFAYNYVHSRETAEEAIQEMFLSLWERRREWDVAGSLKSYLYRAARNRALNFLKHERVELRWAERTRGGRAPGEEEESDPVFDADAQLRLDDLHAALQRAIERLPERCRLAYTLHRQQHLSYSEIAEVMGTTVGTVTIQIGRALKVLRRSLADWMP